jgi:hypothetical protein
MSAFGTKRTNRDVRNLSAFGGKADINLNATLSSIPSATLELSAFYELGLALALGARIELLASNRMKLTERRVAIVLGLLFVLLLALALWLFVDLPLFFPDER